MNYLQESTKLYNKWNSYTSGQSKRNFCTLEKSLEDSQITFFYYKIINEEIKNRKGLGKFLDFILETTYDKKYLFLLSFVTSIQENYEQEDYYWEKIKINLGINNPSQEQKMKILKIFNLFCKGNRIPFFDVYQNSNPNLTNFCGRIYSLLPFTSNEIYALTYLLNKEETLESNDYYQIYEFVITVYRKLFNRVTLEALENHHEPIKIFKAEYDYLPFENKEELFEMGEYFQSFFESYCNELKTIKITKEQQNKIESLLDYSKAASLSYNDFQFYFKTDIENKITEFYIRPKYDQEVEVQDYSGTGKGGNAYIEYKFIGTDATKKLKLPKEEFLVVENEQNKKWLEIKFSKTNKVFKKEIRGHICINEVGLQLCKGNNFRIYNEIFIFHRNLPDEIPIKILEKYSQIDDGSFIEMTGGLAAGRNSYFWFGIPNMIVHNNDQKNIRLQIDDEEIRTQGDSLNEKFQRFVENKIKNGINIFIENGDNNQSSVLEFFVDNKKLQSLRIERQDMLIQLLKNNTIQIEENYPCSNSFCNTVSFSNDYSEFELIEKDQHLLHWISWFAEKGVSYLQFKNAIQIICKKEVVAELEIDSSEIIKLTKRIIEQFIGLGYISTSYHNNQLRYYANKSHFISTHDGSLILTGARSWKETKILLDKISPLIGKRLNISLQNIKIGLPRILKLNPKHTDTQIKLDRNPILQKYSFIGYDKVNGGQGVSKSFPLLLVNSYSCNENEILENGQTLITSIEGYERLNLTNLEYTLFNNINDLVPYDLIKSKRNNPTRHYIFQRLENNDGELNLICRQVISGKVEDAIYLSLKMHSNLNKHNIGWVYKRSSLTLYIPRIANLPHQLRHALQCATGCYSETGFSKRNFNTPAIPNIDNDNITLNKESSKGMFELELFYCVPPDFIPLIEEKLSITITTIK